MLLINQYRYNLLSSYILIQIRKIKSQKRADLLI